MNVHQIIDIVSNVTGVSQEYIVGSSRKTNTVMARHLSLWASRWNTQASLQKIAAIHKLAQHGTVIHAAKNIENIRRYDETIDAHCKAILNQINNN